jgi:hypothetical protein
VDPVQELRQLLDRGVASPLLPFADRGKILIPGAACHSLRPEVTLHCGVAMGHAVVIFSRSRIRLSLRLVRWVPTKVYPTRRFGLDLPTGLRCSFTQWIPAKDPFLAFWLLQRVVASLTRRARPTRSGCPVRPPSRRGRAADACLVFRWARGRQDYGTIPARVGAET